jgi:carboxypeptidase C (cathepsin A)
LFLPTYAATAWYHQRLEPDLQKDLYQTLKEVEEFALTDYMLALARGAALPADDRICVARRLARYTGLSEEYVDQADLRIEIHRFVKQLLRHQRRTVGRLDSRFTGIDLDAAGEKFEFDPSYAAIQGPYTACLNDYVRGDLEFETDVTYEILTDRVRPWSYGEFENRYVNTAETLRKAMSQNRHLAVFVANGYFDLATPYFATRYTFDHLGLDPSLRDNVTMAYYDAGHMMYIHRPSLEKVTDDLVAFIESSAPQG